MEKILSPTEQVPIEKPQKTTEKGFSTRIENGLVQRHQAFV